MMMAIEIFVVPNNRVFSEDKSQMSGAIYIGEIPDDSMLFSESVAQMNRVKLLKLVGPWDNVVFNHQQILYLKDEVLYLLSHSKIKKQILDLLLLAIDKALALPASALKFEID